MFEQKTILIVDDEPAIVALLKSVLLPEGYEVMDARSGEDALYLNARYPFPIHLLVTDVRMGGMSGCDLARSLRDVRPDLKVVYISGYADDGRLQDEMVRGQSEFLAKPFAPRELLERVRRALSAEGEFAAGAAGIAGPA